MSSRNSAVNKKARREERESRGERGPSGPPVVNFMNRSDRRYWVKEQKRRTKG